MRIRNLRIENFRNLARFEMKDLGRINLIVGENNSGKTTILEAISILMARGNHASLWEALDRRREFSWSELNESAGAPAKFYEIRELFSGYEVKLGAKFLLSADTDAGPVQMSAEVNDDYIPGLSAARDEAYSVLRERFAAPWNLSLSWNNPGSQESELPVSRRGLVSSGAIDLAMRATAADGPPLQLVSSSSLTPDAAASSFGEIVLTPEEDLVVDALKLIEPSIERIAVGMTMLHPASIVVKLKGMKDRIPIGSLGEGTWRMLGLALNAVNAKDGILLVDDIDTGLHHTVMRDMWKFLYTASERYNVQVFATTHSRDCYESLAVVCDDADSADGDVTIQRVERGRGEAVAYSEGEIRAAAKYDIEVR